VRGQAVRSALLETEFHFHPAQKTRSQQRLYRRKDIELLLTIRDLLYGQRFTIQGARARLRELGHDEGAHRAGCRPRNSTSRPMRKSSKGFWI